MQCVRTDKTYFRDSDRLWYGCRSGIPALCLHLDAPETLLFKNRKKIKAGAVNGFFIKRYNLSGFFNQLRSYWKTPRPFRVERGAELLALADIKTPEVFAALISWKGFIRQEYLVTALLDEKNQFLNKMLFSGGKDEVWQILTDKFIPALARLHDAGAIHGDLSMRNLYLSEDGHAGMIDLDGMKFFSGKVPAAAREAELGRLISSFYMCIPEVPKEKGGDAVVPEEMTAQAVKCYPAQIDMEKVRNHTARFIRRGRKYL